MRETLKLKSREDKNKGGRVKRVPMNGLERDLLSVEGKNPDYKYRWIYDKDGTGTRLVRAETAGYEFAAPVSHMVGDSTVYKTSDGGSVIRIPGGKGNYQYLMRIRREWYDEDQKAKAQAIDENEASRHQPDSDGQYGKVTTETTLT